jgi:hypothetical protein
MIIVILPLIMVDTYSTKSWSNVHEYSKRSSNLVMHKNRDMDCVPFLGVEASQHFYYGAVLWYSLCISEVIGLNNKMIRNNLFPARNSNCHKGISTTAVQPMTVVLYSATLSNHKENPSAWGAGQVCWNCHSNQI